MKAQHRHELQTNQLAEWLEDAIERLKPYARAIVGVLVAIAIVFGVYSYLSSVERRTAAAASDQLITALEGGSLGELQSTAEAYRGTQPAAVAQLVVAESMLDNGTNQLYSDKRAGRESLFKAADIFAGVEKDSKDPMLRAWALYGLARAHESMGDLDRARDDFQRLLKEYPESMLADSARNHLGRLNQPAVKEFYDWFAKQEPRPTLSEAEPGVPGLKPSFDLKEPESVSPQRSPSDVKLPSALGGSGTSSTPADSSPSSALPSSETPAKLAAPSSSGPSSGGPKSSAPAGASK
jgi:TolA-binding protein